MSEATKRAVHEAIAAHIEDEYDETPIHWILQTENNSIELIENDAHGYTTACSDNISFSGRLGLMMILRNNLLGEMTQEDDED